MSDMEKIISAVGIIAGSFALIFFAPVLGVLLGAFSGWVVGLFFGNTILGVAASLGLQGFSMWQLGASLGFVGGFFRVHRRDIKVQGAK